jgi:Protein of unknown function (DUF2946)
MRGNAPKVPIAQSTANRRLIQPAAWLMIAALVLQTVVGSAVVLRMWSDAQDPLGLAQWLCQDGSVSTDDPAGQDQAPAGSAHDHDHCLLCSVGFHAATVPAMAPLLVPIALRSRQPVLRREAATGRPTFHHRSRAPPALA